MEFLQIKSEEISIKSDELFDVFGIPVTNSMLAGLLNLAVVLILCLLIIKFVKKDGVPGKFQLMIEMMYSVFLGFITKIAGSERIAKKILPIIGTVFIYITLSNLILLIPPLSALEYNDLPLFRTHTNDFNTNFGIAVGLIIWTQIMSITVKNPINHVLQYFPIDKILKAIKHGPGAIFTALIDLFVGLLDVISEIARSLSLSLRLLGNVFAGELLAGLILGLFALALPVPIIFYGIAAGLIQALIFGALTASYFGGAMGSKE